MEAERSDGDAAVRKPDVAARVLALLGALGALALTVVTVVALFVEAHTPRDDGTLRGAVDDAADRISAACVLTVFVPYALIVSVAAIAGIVEPLTTSRGRAAGALAMLFGGLTVLGLFTGVLPAFADMHGEGMPPEGFGALAVIALVAGVNLQAWRLTRRSSS